ncbi:response regulator [Yinghuangia seranimata]|uniref:response regulator n=1 Tax=Yinghuangia seranimata TaxID=408067 RepID=UPI00248B93F7|nr:response regulator transcription factor [Yinghuangia seranimata]MDI2131128.1 response regulator transcription factor [Yinghuangia seranimata]
MTIRVVVADDQRLVRAGLAGILGTDPELAVVGEAATGREAAAVTRTTAPDVVLMDIRMPDMDGIEATAAITCASAARVLMLTTFDLAEYVYGALRAGASGFLLKDVPPADLIAGVKVLAGGDALLAPAITRRLIADFAAVSVLPAAPAVTGAELPAKDAASVTDVITDREHQVLLLVAEGLSNAEIGRRLHISPGTAKTHVARLLAKLGVRDRVHLVVLAYRSGLVKP